MNKRFIYDAYGSVVKEMVVHDAETFTVLSHHDLTPHIESAKIKREAARDRKAHYTEIAEIPDDVVERAFREGWAHDKNAWAKWFNDAQNRVFHTTNDIHYISGREGI